MDGGEEAAAEAAAGRAEPSSKHGIHPPLHPLPDSQCRLLLRAIVLPAERFSMDMGRGASSGGSSGGSSRGTSGGTSGRLGLSDESKDEYRSTPALPLSSQPSYLCCLSCLACIMQQTLSFTAVCQTQRPPSLQGSKVAGTCS
ncbi:unnamed protein product, partial [Closterium sp. NIES-65]